MKTCVQAKIVGRVQGVGFRPTVYRYATESGLTGFVRNDPTGVVLEIEGEQTSVAAFFARLQHDPPSQAIITGIEQHQLAAKGYASFEVIESQTTGPVGVHVPPDLATCDDCLRELNDPQDRRHGYPFINCTNCGPRFTIIRDLPYDRANTSMAGFKMCPACDYEYHEPADRRFHAQPDACEKCGPSLNLVILSEAKNLSRTGTTETLRFAQGDSLLEAVRLLKAGQVVAIKSLGGYHLACTLDAVAKLRERKHRPHKPFAVMFRDLATLKRHCEVSETEEAELFSVARPIVILKSKRSPVSPDFPSIGAFLPYTPLHHLLLAHFDALVMTSGNLAEEPIASEESELPAVADAVLTHNRAIVHKCDDSVVRIVNGQRQLFRRARGFAPNAIRFADDCAQILAVGGELKNTFCLARDGWAFLSQHIGDLKEYKTCEYFEHEITEWQRLMRVKPVAVAHDLHPGYRSTRWAKEKGSDGVLEYWRNGTGAQCSIPALQCSATPILLPVQHHHAHIASVMAEHNLHGEVIGVALDGTGYGTDGTVWGGEFLVATRAEFERVAHFKQYRLPGGEKAIKEPWRMTASVLQTEMPDMLFNMLNMLFTKLNTIQVQTVIRLCETGVNAPLTSSAGRLFDAVAALLGLCDVATYEAQAAIRLEAVADQNVTGHYPFDIRTSTNCHPERSEGSLVCRQTTEILRFAQNDKPLVLDFGRTIRAIREDKQDVATISARFHNTVAAAIVKVCETVRAERGLKTVALSGGVFQNEFLLRRTIELLQAEKFAVFTNTLVPPNDGGLALGQVAVAAERMKRPCA